MAYTRHTPLWPILMPRWSHTQARMPPMRHSEQPLWPASQPDMIRIELQLGLTYQVDALGADFVFNVHAAHTPHQCVAFEALAINQSVPTWLDTDPATGNRRLRLRAWPGELALSYRTAVEVTHHTADPHQVHEVPVAQLPPEVLCYLYPSRYCQSDRLLPLAAAEFGHLAPGYTRVQAIQQWVQQRVCFAANTSNASTSALDTLLDRVGICRDFAHLMIALCRAVNLPARFTTGTDFGADPRLGPPDFHAYVEVYLGHRWYIFDASGIAIPMGLMRLGTGRDAADVAFATIFGNVQAHAPVLWTQAVADPGRGLVVPHHRPDALSTCGAG